MSNPGQAFARLAQQLNRARQQAQRSTGGGGAGGGGPGGPAGLLAGSGMIIVLVAGGLVLNASLFNVDGGHRAIKYSRLHGVMSKIYPEGTHIRVSTSAEMLRGWCERERGRRAEEGTLRVLGAEETPEGIGWGAVGSDRASAKPSIGHPRHFTLCTLASACGMQRGRVRRERSSAPLMKATAVRERL